MYGLVEIEVMILSRHLSNIDEISLKKESCKDFQSHYTLAGAPVATPSYGSRLNPISTTEGQIMPTLYWCSHQVLKATGAAAQYIDKKYP